MIRIIGIGRIKDRRMLGLIEDYMKRIRPLAPLEIIEIKDSNPEKEAREMVARVGSASGKTLVIAMDEKGEDLSSNGLSKILGSQGSICFLIGGPDGLGSLARERATRTIRLSSMTFTHEMARVLLLEQIYRGFSILKGKPYHRA